MEEIAMIDIEEVFTDNSKLEQYKLCKTCKFNNGGDNWSNKFDKDYCAVFMYPESKPNEIMHNGPCDFYKEK